MESRVDLLKKKYGYLKGSYKYVPAGSEILKLIGQDVILVTFTRTQEGTEDTEPVWENVFERVHLLSVYNYDPMTMTYDCKYLRHNEEENKDEEEVIKIIPEGFSWGNPEETGEMKRFVPYSIHCQMVEDEAFNLRVKELYDTRKTLSVEELTTIFKSKETDTILKYSHNIGAAVKLDDGDVLWIRIHSLSIHHKNGSKYSLKFSNNDRSWSMMIDSSDEEYNFEDIGKVKIIDLADK